jgi:lysophospholipase L1-like esterase
MAITPASATVAVTAGTTLVVTTAPYGPFSTVLTRLANGQSTTIQIIGDSTAAGQYDTGNLQGWVGRLGILLGQYYNANVVYRDFSTSLYSSTGSYTAPVSLYSSSNGSGAPQILLMNGGVPGANLNNQNQWLSGGLLPISNPDVIIVAEGFNDLSSLGLRDSAATYTAALRSFISAVSTTCPNVPIIITTENVPDGIYTYSTFAAGFSAMTQSYVGQSLPLSPPLQQSGTSEVWLLDTQQAFPSSQLNTLTTTLDGGYRLHPSPAGYAAQASYMLAQLAPSIAAPSVVIPTPATVTVVGGTPTTNYAFVSPAPATVFITGVTPVVTGITNAITPAAASIALTTTAPVTILGGNTSAIPTAATIALGTTAPLIALQVGTPTLTVTQNWGNPNLTGTVTFWPIQPTGPAATAQIIGGVLCDANGNFGVTLTSALAPGGGPAIYLVSVDLIYYGWREVEIPRFAIPAVGNTVNGNTVNLGSAFPAVNHRLGIPADAVRASDTLTLPLEEDMTVYIDPAPQWVQANDAVLDYTLDWSLPLASTGDTVAAATFTPSYIAGQASQLTVVSTNTTPTTATVWLTGGVSGQLYSVMCHIITAEGRQDDRTFQVLVQNT